MGQKGWKVMGKILFFDIDGTLWDEEERIPESTKEALKKLRENGHRTFICSGRARSCICNPELLGAGFDGIVSGCGTMIEYQGETLFYHRMEAKEAIHMVEFVRGQGFEPLLEGRYHVYMDKEFILKDVYTERLQSTLKDLILPLTENWGQWEISKCTVAGDRRDSTKAFAPTDDRFGYIVHSPSLVEIVPKGFHKGTGIRKVCELLHGDVADTFAFGDSANDMEMIRTAGTGIAMGNATADLKEAADYVTSSLENDGIWHACRHFGLI